MEEWQIVLVTTVVLLAVLGAIMVLCYQLVSIRKEGEEEKKKLYEQGLMAGKSSYRPTMSFEEVNKVLVTIISDALTQKQKLVYDLQDMVMYDFNKEVKDLSTDVFLSLSNEFKREFSYYQTEEFLKKHIVDYCMVLLLDDLSKRKPPVGSQAMRKSSSVIRA